MHGRIKTISSDEQKKKQKIARLLKLEQFNLAKSRIFEKRDNEEYDSEALKLTADLLVSNPNIITFWNYRREILSQANESCPPQFNEELALTEMCLRSDPKSYGTWHHRLWVLDKLPVDVWEKELKLCNKMLDLDERNFHCWDYRKIIVERAKIQAKDEYNFTTSKIESNFSNYSAWHLRSKVLPLVFEDPLGKYPVEEIKYKEELELVLNAAFTDPDDQSSWFYQRWLLRMLNPPLGLVWAQASSDNVIIALSQPVGEWVTKALTVSVRGSTMTGRWLAMSATKTSPTWKFQFLNPVENDTIEIALTVETGNVEHIQVARDNQTQKIAKFVPIYNADLLSILNEQLDCCEKLLELEPDSKWTLLTSALLMRYSNYAYYGGKILSYIKILMERDKLRRGFYNDFYARVAIELTLIEKSMGSSFEMTNCALHSLYHAQYFSLATVIDLSKNHLSSEDLHHLHSLINCKELNLSYNDIQGITQLPIINTLVCLHLVNNPLKSIANDINYLMKFPSLDISKIQQDFGIINIK